MDSASLQFVLFGLITAALSNLRRSRLWRSIVLMAASLIFLAVLAKSAVSVVPSRRICAFGLWRSRYAGARLVEGRRLDHSGSDLGLRVVEEVYVSCRNGPSCTFPISLWGFLIFFSASCIC